MKLNEAQKIDVDQIYHCTLELKSSVEAMREVAADLENFDIEDYTTAWQHLEADFFKLKSHHKLVCLRLFVEAFSANLSSKE